MEGSHAADELSPGTRELFEQLLKRLGATAGRWRVAIDAKDGKLLHVDVAELRIPASELSRFDP